MCWILEVKEIIRPVRFELLATPPGQTYLTLRWRLIWRYDIRRALAVQIHVYL